MSIQIKEIIQNNQTLYDLLFSVYSKFMSIVCYLTPINKKQIIFCSLSGRNYDDSPLAIYNEILKRHEFDSWNIIWAFKTPKDFSIPRGKCVKFGNLSYWKILFSSKVWVGNGGIDNGIEMNPCNRVIVNTWHGSPLKKIEGEENSNAVLKKYRKNRKLNKRTIRCAQNDFDVETFARVFRSSSECFLKCGLPRNDILLKYNENDKKRLRKALGVPDDKKVILYMPTYREYLINDSLQTFIAPPISIKKWKEELSSDYVFFIRAHYAVSSALNLEDDSFCRNVSKYKTLSELYLIADLLITDYSSCFFDYAILEKPVLCFAYDREEYEAKRGLYLKLEDVMPCGVYADEDSLIKKIQTMDYQSEIKKMVEFKKQWVKYYGNASKAIVDEISKRIQLQKTI